MQNESQRPANPDQTYHEERETGEQQGYCDERLDHHEPHRQQPFSDDVVFLREDVMAAVELLVELVAGITEILKAIFPEPHVLEIAECLLIGFDPIRTGRKPIR